MGDDICSGSVTDCRLRSFSDHTQQCRAAQRQKSKQTQPNPCHHPLTTQLNVNIKYKSVQIYQTQQLRNFTRLFTLGKLDMIRQQYSCVNKKKGLENWVTGVFFPTCTI